ncbi:hypothetical protein QUA43_14465 [Microcoleus sp. N9_B4]|uniref:hypothetical protein n=1 Tax=Microcoleus sp. N9_B4 TaxID=3055386 RepID=UPI002FCF33B9
MYPKQENFQPFSQLFFTKIYYPLWGYFCDRAIGGFAAGDRLLDIDSGFTARVLRMRNVTLNNPEELF